MSLTEGEQTARDALRARQGKGARYDAPEAPSEDLLLARRATAFFARKLNELDDAALTGPRARIVAAVAHDARRMALALEPLCPGNDTLPPETFAADLPSLNLAATLPPRALRHLFDHSAIHLDVCWRDLPGPVWETVVGTGDTAEDVRALPRRRALTLWRQVIALGNGATPGDVPPVLRGFLAKGDDPA